MQPKANKEKGNTTASTKTYRVVVIEWLSHKGLIEATSAEEAEAKSREMWANNAEHETFKFEDSGIDGVTAEEVLDACKPRSLRGSGLHQPMKIPR